MSEELFDDDDIVNKSVFAKAGIEIHNEIKMKVHNTKVAMNKQLKKGLGGDKI